MFRKLSMPPCISSSRAVIYFLLSAVTFVAACGSNNNDPPLTPDLITAVNTFIQGTGANSQPDSIALTSGAVWVAFGDGNLPDGSDGKTNAIVEYSASSGAVIHTFTVTGHNDGLKTNPADGMVWAMQNEDGNPNLVIINPKTNTQSQFTFGPTPQGGGYDDIVFANGNVFLSASNPQNNPNTDPAIVQATIVGSQVNVTPFFFGNSSATDIPSNAMITLNLQDPDSMTLDGSGNLVLDSQSDSEVIFLTSQGARRLPITSSGKAVTIDDTIFPTPSQIGTLYVSDRGSNTVFALNGFNFSGQPFSASDSGNFVGKLNLSTGVLTPVLSGLKSPHGMAFKPLKAN